MIVRSRFARTGWLLAALFQLLLPAMASVADARAEAESFQSASRIHIEPDGATGCPRVHPADCALCRVLATTAAAGTPASVHVAVASFLVATIDDSDRAVCVARFPGDPPQRAPPVLS